MAISHQLLSRKPLLFKSFTDQTVEELDDIYNKEITKRYERYDTTVIQKKIEKESLVQEDTSS